MEKRIFEDFFDTSSVGMARRTLPNIYFSIFCLLLVLLVECKKKGKSTKKSDETPTQTEKDENDPKQAFLSYGNNPLLDAARDNNVNLVRKIVDRVPGVFTDARFSKWEYDDPEDYPDIHDRNDVIAIINFECNAELTSFFLI